MTDAQQRSIDAIPTIPVIPRLYTVPKRAQRLTSLLAAPLSSTDRKPEFKRDTAMLRVVAYVRISSEDQVGNYSIDAQMRAIKQWIEQHDAKLVKVYSDEALSGRTAQRPAFQEMRQDARKGKFDALIVHKLDRFARNRTDALAIKSLLRYDLGIKVYSVTEPTEDSEVLLERSLRGSWSVLQSGIVAI